MLHEETCRFYAKDPLIEVVQGTQLRLKKVMRCNGGLYSTLRITFIIVGDFLFKTTTLKPAVPRNYSISGGRKIEVQ